MKSLPPLWLPTLNRGTIENHKPALIEYRNKVQDSAKFFVEFSEEVELMGRVLGECEFSILPGAQE